MFLKNSWENFPEITDPPPVFVPPRALFLDETTRGIAFILDRNRLNVALSRAQALAIVVGDPNIASTPAGSIKELSLLNTFCRLASAAPKP